MPWCEIMTTGVLPVASRTAVTTLVRAHDADGVRAALDESPSLLAWRDPRGRNWLHLCCTAKPSGKVGGAKSVATADVLLGLGFDIDEAAFTEDDWRATPLWHAVARGENLELAEHLLELGADPNHCLFAAAFKSDLDAIDLLVSHGADVDERAEGETPFLGAVGWSHFAPAERLLEHGADVNATTDKGQTALHLMLKKSSDRKHFEMLLRYEPRGDIPDASGATAAEIMRRKRDAEFRAMADRLALEERFVADPIFHIAFESDWRAAREAGAYRVSTRGTPLDDIGFIHASFRHQVPVIRSWFYEDVDEPLVVLVIDTERLEVPVVVEDGGGGEDFPHVYGALPVAAVVEVRSLDDFEVG
jgi:uncharacterized protein (DUF952 family)